MSGAEREAARTMRAAAGELLTALDADRRAQAAHPADDPARTRWAYQPRPRPGTSLLGLGEPARKAAHRLLATAVSRPVLAQAVTIMALEEVLDVDEGGHRRRHSDDYWVAVFGGPADDAWSWRFEGHHVSVTATVADDRVAVAPLFLGANPARVHRGDQLVLAPLSWEEDLARTLVTELDPALRSRAIVDGVAPADILTGTDVRVPASIEPLGIRAADLTGAPRDLLDRLLDVYLDRLTPGLASTERGRIALDEVSFAWAGGVEPGDGHYYRIQAPDLIIEYDNTQREANHAHTVLRRPEGDFGADLLAAHLAGEST
jgi:hypothetical protein